MDGGVMAGMPPPRMGGPRFSGPPPNFNVPPPNFNQPPPNFHKFMPRGANPGARYARPAFGADEMGGSMFDGKRMRKSVYRKTVDYNSSVVNYVENRLWQRSQFDHRGFQPDALYTPGMVPPPNLLRTPMNCVTSRFIRTSTNKIKCPIFCVCWTPEGRRLVTGASSGEFTLWNGLTFNFETILQAHDTSVRAMVWSHNDQWMLTADHTGFVKYWQSNMNNVKMYQAHKDPIRDLSFCPSDAKYASCSDDATVRVWDFMRCHEEKILRGHGADVKCVDWHPQKALIASGSKDTQQPVKLWDPRTGNSLATIHAHKHTVMEVKWNQNGNWLLTASRDHLLKLFDIRKMKEELQSFKGHKKEATTVAWHPIHEGLFASGGSDGALMFWLVGHDKEVGSIDEAHEAMVWSLGWHPLGHLLASGSNDHTTKFWTRNRPGDAMRDKYNLNTLPYGMSEDMLEYDIEPTSTPCLPGMGLEFGLPDHLKPKIAEKEKPKEEEKPAAPSIPGLDWDETAAARERAREQQSRDNLKKIPFAKPVPKNFEAAWESGVQPPNIEGGAPAGNQKPAKVGLLGNRPGENTNNANSGNMDLGGAPDIQTLIGAHIIAAMHASAQQMQVQGPRPGGPTGSPQMGPGQGQGPPGGPRMPGNSAGNPGQGPMQNQGPRPGGPNQRQNPGPMQNKGPNQMSGGPNQMSGGPNQMGSNQGRGPGQNFGRGPNMSGGQNMDQGGSSGQKKPLLASPGGPPMMSKQGSQQGNNNYGHNQNFNNGSSDMSRGRGRGHGGNVSQRGSYQGSERGGFQGSDRGGYQGSDRGGNAGSERGGFQGGMKRGLLPDPQSLKRSWDEASEGNDQDGQHGSPGGRGGHGGYQGDRGYQSDRGMGPKRGRGGSYDDSMRGGGSRGGGRGGSFDNNMRGGGSRGGGRGGSYGGRGGSYDSNMRGGGSRGSSRGGFRGRGRGQWNSGDR